MDEQTVVTTLSESECWDFLEAEEIGRLAFHLAGEVHIAPVNYVVQDRAAIIFRTAEGNKLLGLHMDADVAFEIDQVGQESGKSVILRGTAETVPMSADYIADELGLKPWVPNEKFHVIRVIVKELSGRHFSFDRA